MRDAIGAINPAVDRSNRPLPSHRTGFSATVFSVQNLLHEIRQCTVCAANLPHEPRPVVVAHPKAQLLIIGQAPGRRVHESGIPWNDPSGDRLRQWLAMDRDAFYDEQRVALMPMGFCFPGTGKSGDLPPRPECAPLWHERLLAELPQVRLTLLVGMYAQKHYLGAAASKTLTDTVRGWRRHLPRFLPLPHPSPRNQLWLKRNPWFEAELVPALQQQLATSMT